MRNKIIQNILLGIVYFTGIVLYTISWIRSSIIEAIIATAIYLLVGMYAFFRKGNSDERG